MNRKKYLAKNTALFTLNSIGTKLISFLLVPLYTNAFVTSEYGVIDLVTTIATLFVPIITINIGEAVMRFCLDEDANKNEIISTGLLFSALSLLFGTTIFGIIRFFSQININPYIIYLYCVIQGIYQVLSCILRGQENLLQFAIANIISSFSSAILNILFLTVFHFGVNGYFVAYIIAYFIATIYCLIAGHINTYLHNFSLKKDVMNNMIKYSIVLVPNSLMWWIMNSSDHIMVTKMIGVSANGIYGISYKLPSILSALSTVFNQAWSYSAIHENNSSDRVEFNNNMYDKLVRFQLVVTACLMCFMKPFMRIYVDSAYYEAWKYTPYLLVGYFFLTMGTFLSTSYTVNKDSKGFLFSGTFGAVINIFMNWITIPVLGIHGAAFSTCISYICVFIYRLIDTRKYMVIKVLKKEYVIMYALLLLIAVSMSVDGLLGQIILLCEIVVMIILNKDFIIICIKQIIDIIKRIIK